MNRIIPIPSKLFEIIKEYQGDDDSFLLEGKTYEYTDPRTYQYNFQKYLKSCDIRHVNFHALRHTFATRFVENGFDIKSLSEILGHADASTTLRRYVHPSMDLKRKQMERLSTISICGQNSGRYMASNH